MIFFLHYRVLKLQKFHFLFLPAGDPDDRTLRKVESEVLIKERMRVKARKELCEPFNLGKSLIFFGLCHS